MTKVAKQSVVLIALLAIGASLAGWKITRPLDAETLRVRVSQQQSLAAEAAQLARLQRDQALPREVARQHARLLVGKIAEGARALRAAQVEPELEASRKIASDLSSELLAQGEPMQEGPAPGQASFERIAAALKKLGEDLERSGQ